MTPWQHSPKTRMSGWGGEVKMLEGWAWEHTVTVQVAGEPKCASPVSSQALPESGPGVPDCRSRIQAFRFSGNLGRSVLTSRFRPQSA